MKSDADHYNAILFSEGMEIGFGFGLESSCSLCTATVHERWYIRSSPAVMLLIYDLWRQRVSVSPDCVSPSILTETIKKGKQYRNWWKWVFFERRKSVVLHKKVQESGYKEGTCWQQLSYSGDTCGTKAAKPILSARPFLWSPSSNYAPEQAAEGLKLHHDLSLYLRDFACTPQTGISLKKRTSWGLYGTHMAMHVLKREESFSTFSSNRMHRAKGVLKFVCLFLYP